MSIPSIAPLGDHGEDEVIAYVVAAQRDPARHVTFLGDEPVSVRADLTGVTAWRDRTLVARHTTGAVAGVLTVDVDEDLGRLWWLGPWTDDEATARRLIATGGELAPHVREREFAPDSRNADLARLAADLGYRAEAPSAVLTLELTDWEPPSGGDTAPPVSELHDDDRQAVAALHDHLFTGTHTRGRDLVRDDDTRVLIAGDGPDGYVATQVQADGTLYIDFLGVDPAVRGRGLGRTLLVAALQHAQAHGVPRAHLTVRADNLTALHLYGALGFVEERRIAPYRRGFSRDS